MSIYNDVFLIDNELRVLQDGEETDDVVLKSKILEETKNMILNIGLEKLAKIHKNREAEIKAIKEEEIRLKQRRESLEKKDEGLLSYMREIFKLTGENKQNYGNFTFSWRKSSQCAIDENIFDDDRFITVEEIKKIDKMSIKKALISGEEIKGATLIENENLQIK